MKDSVFGTGEKPIPGLGKHLGLDMTIPEHRYIEGTKQYGRSSQEESSIIDINVIMKCIPPFHTPPPFCYISIPSRELPDPTHDPTCRPLPRGSANARSYASPKEMRKGEAHAGPAAPDADSCARSSSSGARCWLSTQSLHRNSRRQAPPGRRPASSRPASSTAPPCESQASPRPHPKTPTRPRSLNLRSPAACRECPARHRRPRRHR